MFGASAADRASGYAEHHSLPGHRIDIEHFRSARSGSSASGGAVHRTCEDAGRVVAARLVIAYVYVHSWQAMRPARRQSADAAAAAATRRLAAILQSPLAEGDRVHQYVSWASMRAASANVSHSHFRDSASRRTAFLTSRGMSIPPKNTLGGTTIALHNDRIVKEVSEIQALHPGQARRPAAAYSWANEMCRASSVRGGHHSFHDRITATCLRAARSLRVVGSSPAGTPMKTTGNGPATSGTSGETHRSRRGSPRTSAPTRLTVLLEHHGVVTLSDDSLSNTGIPVGRWASGTCSSSGRESGWIRCS